MKLYYCDLLEVRRYYLPKNSLGDKACSKMGLESYPNTFTGETLKDFLIQLHGEIHYFADVQNDWIEFSISAFPLGILNLTAAGIMGENRNLDLSKIGI